MDALHSRILHSGFALVLQMQLCWASPSYALQSQPARFVSASPPPKVKAASLRIAGSKKNKPSALLPVFYRHSIALQRALKKIVVADFNGDGFADIAGLEERSTKLAVLYGLGNLMFSDARQIDLRAEAVDLAAADFNGDRTGDLVVLFSKAAKIRFFLGGKSERLTQGGEIDVEAGTKKMWLTDAEGKTELFAVGDAGGVQSFRQIERSKDRVRFRRDVKRFPQLSFSTLLLDNFTGSEQGFDFVLADALAKELLFMRNERIVALAEPVRFTFGTEITAIAAADVNQNTVPEVVLSLSGQKLTSESESDAGQVAVLYDVGIGTGVEPLVLAAGPAPAKNLLRDFNLDGFTDIAVLDGEEQTVSIFLGKEDGGFTGRIPFGTGGAALDFAAENIDGDRFPELIFSDTQSSTLCICTATPPKVFTTASAEPAEAVRLVAGSEPKSLQLSEGKSFSLYACAEKSRSLAVFGFESLWMHRRFAALPVEARWMWLLQKSAVEKNGDKITSNPVSTSLKKSGEKNEPQLLLVSRTREKIMLVKLTDAPIAERQAEAKLLVTDLAGASLIESQSLSPLLMLHDAGDLQVQPQYLFFNLAAEIKSDTKTEFKFEPLLASAMLSPEKSLAVSFPKSASKLSSKNLPKPLPEPQYISIWTAGAEQGREVLQPFQVGAARDAQVSLTAAKEILLRRRAVTHRPPHRLLCADFDGDGKPDYVAASASGATALMSRRLFGGEEINNFVPLTKTDYFGAMDVNGDGFADLLTGNRRDGTLSVWIKSTSGGGQSFEPPVKVLSDADAEDALLVEVGGETVLAVANSRQDTIDLVSLKVFAAKPAPRKPPR